MTPPGGSLDAAEIARRLPVWAAMSDLYLDTESDVFAPAIARALLAAGYSAADGEAMLRWEVRPAFWPNCLATAGEWEGWPEAFVRDRVVKARRSRLARLILGHDRLFPRTEWARVERLITEAQAASIAGSVAAIQPPPSTRSSA